MPTCTTVFWPVDVEFRDDGIRNYILDDVGIISTRSVSHGPHLIVYGAGNQRHTDRRGPARGQLSGEDPRLQNQCTHLIAMIYS